MKRTTFDRAGSSSTEAVQGLDWTLVGLYLILVIIGWLMVYAADYDPARPSLLDWKTTYGKQTIFVIAAILVGGFTLLIDNRFFKSIAYFFYGGSVLLLLITLFVAPNIKGAHAWLPLFNGFNLQTGEIAKFATALALANFLGGYDTNLRDYRTMAYTIGIIILPMAIILLQNDTGSMLVFLSFFIMLYREGMPAWLYIIGILFGVLAVLTLIYDLMIIFMLLLVIASAFLISQFHESRRWWVYIGLAIAAASVGGMYYGLQSKDAVHYPNYWAVLAVIITDLVFLVTLATLQYIQKKQQFVLFVALGLLVAGGFSSGVNFGFNNILQHHQQERIYVWLKPEKCDPKGPLYNVNQSKIAIGSGRLLGKGFLHGNVTKLNYVPEQVTDFIFCTVGEEQGFIGSVGLLALYVFLLIRIIYIGERQRSKFTRIYAYCVAGILFFHFTINIGMTMGMLPVIGIPLPFLSYGGSSLLSFTVLLAVLVKFDASRAVSFR